ncbi:hypothetical protein [Campylobacter hyointestinalis]|uniref:hypothetical protein n=1 Tax=Campylobacter hyointestinalis TaxID=198 RepID=UPI000729786C|nr:hypothetical protein [Campylobacter hyointestinalis]PPB63113.1 hypothetical protein CDQ72_01575 [Campylobacter hyointestinalis subsp. hyointestinalis]PPB65383.1 hypothetical protein CDQ73_01325 [Campylobacter hyointestinalis subsp. hyointestinalis]CUU71999.1 Uncharacterised protein [Campylobacter hyointestinalis subsp. hyointestinalis]
MKTLELFLIAKGYEVNASADGKIITAFKQGNMLRGQRADFGRSWFSVIGKYIVCTQNGKVVDVLRS